MGTNNTAELNALHQGLLLAGDEIAKGKTAAVFSDSQYSIQCVVQWAIGWEKAGWKKAIVTLAGNDRITLFEGV